MPQDRPEATPREEVSTRDAGMNRPDATERERNLESRREVGVRDQGQRRSMTRRTPYYGASTSPFTLMRQMADEIDRLFSDFDMGRASFGMQRPRFATAFDPWRSDSRLSEATWVPTVETFRRNDNIVIRADLPGLTKDDIDIQVEDDMLTISGERSEETRDERDDYYRSERTYGRFFRAIPLPDGVESEKIDASFKDGVLEVTIPTPKVTTPKNRQIKIK